MEEPTRIILWDFDGTLAYKPGLWSGTLMKVLDMYVPDHKINISQIKPYLQKGFPWHKSDESHHHLSTPESWWLQVEGVIANAYRAVGVSQELSGELARLVHQHVILSNHVPELPQIVEQLGLNQLIWNCISSAAIGYKKPHPEAFKIALSAFNNLSSVWMVGDSLEADVFGAQKMNIPAILVHSAHSEDVKYYASTLNDVITIIEDQTGAPHAG